MRLAICDDNPQDLKQLSALLHTYDPGIHVDTFAAAAALYESTRENAYDAVILDIEMETPNGYEIALRLARDETHPIILFLTNSAAYAVQGYGLALRYLLKPLTIDKLAEAMSAVQQEIRSNRLTITLDGTTHVWKVQDIYYAEVINHHVSLYTNSGVFSFRGSLRELMAQLPDRWFSAPHQSYIINLLHVKSVSFQSVYLTDGTDIPVSRRKQREFTQSFHRFLGV